MIGRTLLVVISMMSLFLPSMAAATESASPPMVQFRTEGWYFEWLLNPRFRSERDDDVPHCIPFRGVHLTGKNTDI